MRSPAAVSWPASSATLPVAPLLALDTLRKVYGHGDTAVTVLDGVTARFDEHCLVAIAGPSGGGKSTLLSILGCLDSADAGAYRVAGELVRAGDRVQHTRLRAAMFGFVFQSFNLVPVLTALENVELALVPLGVARRAARERAASMLERVGLGDRLGHRPGALSGGQQQRVAIARALVKTPRVIFADEPTANLDEASVAGIASLIDDLHANDGVSFVVATHDARLSARMSEEYVMRQGQLGRVR